MIGSLLLNIFLLGGCQPSYEDKLDDYLGRLENVLTVDIDQKNQPETLLSLKRFPDRKDTQNNLPFKPSEATIGLLDFLSLKQCKLQQIIASKNDNLGKVATTSQKLLNSLEFIEHAPACLQSLKEENKTTLFQKLHNSLDYKQQQLPSLLWQALINEKEYREFWKTSNHDPLYPESLPDKQVDALLALQKFSLSVLNNQSTDINLENQLGVIRLGDGGQLLFAYLTMHNKLEIANQLIEIALKRPFCFPIANTSNPKVKILNTIIAKFFIPEIQQHANQLNQRYEKIMPVILGLEEQFTSFEHPEHSTWRLNRNLIFDKARSAPKRHVQLINRIYQQCGLKPGG